MSPRHPLLGAAPYGAWPGTPAATSASPAAPQLPAPDRHWDLLVVCLAGYVLTAVGRVHQVFEFLEPLRLALVSAVLAIGLYVASHGAARRLQPVLRNRITRGVVALGCWMALSIPGALWPGGAFHLFSDEFLKTVVMVVVLIGAARGFRDVERLTFAYLLGAAIYAAVILTRFDVGGGTWRLGLLYYYDANEFATLAVMSLPLGVYFMMRPGPWWQRLVGALALGFLTVGFIWTGSRGGFLALLAVGGFLLVRYTAVHAGWRILTTALLALVFAATASDTYWEKMQTILQPKDDYNVTGQQGRVQVWKRGLGYMMQHPVFGVGAANFPTAEGTISPVARSAPVGRGVKWSAAHNSFLQVGAELGLPGLILFLFTLAAAFRALRTVERSQPGRPRSERSPPAVQLAQALGASLFGFVVGGFFLSLAYHDMLYVLLALIAALGKVVIPRLATPRASRPFGSANRAS